MFPGAGTVFFVLLPFLHLAAADLPINYTECRCSGPTLFAANSTYASNLDAVLASLSAKVSTAPSGFADSTVGSTPSTVVCGLALCRGDVSADKCATCLSLATCNLRSICPLQKEAIVWEEECMLRYANRNIFSSMQDEPTSTLHNVNNVSGDAWMRVLESTVTDVTTRAASAASGKKKFATREEAYMALETLYSLAQCTPDLTEDDCAKCLQAAKGILPVHNEGGICWNSA